MTDHHPPYEQSASITPARTPSTRRGKPARKRPSPGWIPNYHGAWAMITVPVLLGVILGGFVWEHLMLLGLWWVGYFAFFATGMWLRSKRRARYFPPVRAYVLGTVPFAIGVLVTAPYAVWWIPLFLPLIATTVWASMNRKDRSMVNNMATVGAAGLTLPVAYDIGTGGQGGLWGTGLLMDTLPHWPGLGSQGSDATLTAAADTAFGALGSSDPTLISLAMFPGSSANGELTGWLWTWLVTLVVAWYFLGTVFYVKTNIRERGERGWLIATTVFHGVGMVFVVALAAIGLFSWWLAALWVIIFLRALLVPIYGQREGWLSAKAIGIGEVVVSIALVFTIL